MFTGAHLMVYSTDADADRAFTRDALKLSCVDAGGGWLIFALPPAELGFHPAAALVPGTEVYLMCDDVEATAASLRDSGVETSAIEDQGWGRVMHVAMPSGAQLGIYQPRHARPS
jgi:predicted enzyme related to lactoylglutathione lyase